jgi:hypothetical protein
VLSNRFLILYFGTGRERTELNSIRYNSPPRKPARFSNGEKKKRVYVELQGPGNCSIFQHKDPFGRMKVKTMFSIFCFFVLNELSARPLLTWLSNLGVCIILQDRLLLKLIALRLMYIAYKTRQKYKENKENFLKNESRYKGEKCWKSFWPSNSTASRP